MAAELRSNMAAKQITVAEVAEMVGRTRVQVTRYRMGQTPIPLDVAQALNRGGLLSDDSVLGKDAA
jgi:cyanate lyase